MKRVNFLGILFFLAGFLVLNAQEQYVFIGSYNKDEQKEGIYVYKLDSDSGSMEKISSVRDVLNPAYLDLSQNGKFLYACTGAQVPGKGSVSSFAFDGSTGSLKFINQQPSGGDNPAYLSVHQCGKWLAVANYTGGSMAVFPISSDGTIGPFVKNVVYHGSGVDKERQAGSHVHSAVFSPDYNQLFFSDLGTDKIRSYLFDATATQPLKEADPPFFEAVPGSGPRHLVFHPNGEFAYGTEEMSGAIGVYRFKDGQLKRIQRIMAHPSEIKEGYSMADIHISKDGKFLYASNRGKENNIAIFSVQKNGKLEGLGFEPTLGEHPRSFALDSYGKFLIVANQFSGNVVVFRRDMVTGLLQKTGNEIKLDNPSCIKIREY